MWTLVMAAFFSIAGFYHTYYLSMLAPGVAALGAIGAIELWHDYTRPIWQGWLLPAALLITAAVQGYILASFPAYATWLTPLVLGVALLAAAILAMRRAVTLGLVALPAWAGAWAHTPILPRAALGLALAALLLPSLIWSGVSVTQAASSPLPHAGPAATIAFGGPGGFGGRGFPGGQRPFGPPPGGFAGNPPTGFPGGANGQGGQGAPSGTATFGGGPGASANSALIAYLEANQGTAKYLVATMSANQAAPIILATSKPVMALGGFTGSDPILTVAQLRSLVQSGQVRYFLLGGGGFGGGPGGRDANNSALTAWVTANCTAVSASASGASGLYVCAA
jgi:hypothetical protein